MDDRSQRYLEASSSGVELSNKTGTIVGASSGSSQRVQDMRDVMDTTPKIKICKLKFIVGRFEFLSLQLCCTSTGLAQYNQKKKEGDVKDRKGGDRRTVELGESGLRAHLA